MKAKLLQALDATQQSDLKENFIHSKPLRVRLIETLEREIETMHASMRDEEWWSSPNWDKIQADRIAQIKAYKKVISLLSEKSL